MVAIHHGTEVARGLGGDQFFEVGPQWQAAEDELLALGRRVPLCYRLSWVQHHPGTAHRLLVVRGDGGRVLGGVAIATEASRILPGHRYLRVTRFGESLHRAAIEPMVASLARYAQSDPRVLRLSVEVFSRKQRGYIADKLEREGYTRTTQPRSYRHTLTLDLDRELDAIRAGLHKTARKNLRAAENAHLRVETLSDPSFAMRIAAIQRETMLRTGGSYRRQDWAPLIELSRLHPEISRVCGVFAADVEATPANLLAFSWGCVDGDHGKYMAAGMTRFPKLRVPAGYPLLWDLIGWSHAGGAKWFDLGGVTLGDVMLDPLEGISDFKRYFSREVEEVGEEWKIEPNPVRARLVTTLGRGMHRLANLVSSATTRVAHLENDRT